MKPISIFSPNKNIEVNFAIQKNGRKQNLPHYSAKFKNKPIILDSILGLKIRKIKDFVSGWQLKDTQQNSCNDQWTPIYGERTIIPNNYNESIFTLERGNNKKNLQTIQIIIRVFDEGFAIRYHIPLQETLKNIVIENEHTQFHFPTNSWCYEEHGYEGKYHFNPVSKTRARMERPLTVVVDPETSGEKSTENSIETYLVITDANVIDYSPMQLSPVRKKSNCLKVNLGASHRIHYPGNTIHHPKNRFDVWKGQVSCSSPFSTAWRVIMVGEKPGDLIENNYLIENLCEPCKIEDPSWIKPGKIIREMKMATNTGKIYVDFAVEHGINYLHWDAGWYGHESDMNSDPTTISIDPKKIDVPADHPGLNFHEVIAYAKEKGIGIWVYVNYRHLELHLDKILPLYHEWGINGIKFGFVRYGPHQCQKWLIDAVRKCADHQIMVDIHDAYRPSGISRTYPNLLTQEGIRGNEHRPTPTHNCTVPFTRFCTGAADYTISYYRNKVQTTYAHQIALSVIYYCPAQFLFWYDDPSYYDGEKELEFFKRLVTVWDDTKVIEGKIGKYITMARKKDDVWFVGAITNEEARELNIPLTFLDEEKQYECSQYYDDLTLTTKTKVAITTQVVGSSDRYVHKIVGRGGIGLIFDPIE
jgi:alpha-glucosidase